jgi:predicted DNA-binding ribbon-helix-helix protein
MGVMKSLGVKRLIMIVGRFFSVSLEEAFWKGLNGIAVESGLTLSELVANINSERHHTNLPSAIRLFVTIVPRSAQCREREALTLKQHNAISRLLVPMLLAIRPSIAWVA